MNRLTIRRVSDRDHAAIAGVVAAAFGRPDEAELVAALRAGGHVVLSLVAEADDAIVGHVLFSRLDFQPEPGTPQLKAAGLAPVAVAPQCQGQGIGTALIREGLQLLAMDGEDLCIVLGEPAYYRRFGFDAELAARLASPYAGPFLMGRAFTPAGAEARGGVAYAEPFGQIA